MGGLGTEGSLRRDAGIPDFPLAPHPEDIIFSLVPGR